MAGTRAEQSLIAAILQKPSMHALTDGLVSRADFSDDRMGVVFEKILTMISKGEAVEPVVVADRFPEWDIRGLGFGDLMEWDEGVYAGSAADYARAVRSAALRRTATEVASFLSNEARDGGSEPADSLSRARTWLDSAIEGASSGRIQLKSLAEVMAGSSSYDWVIPDLLERQDRVILTGAEGGGKSTLVRQISIMAAAGLHPFQRDAEIRNGRTFFSPTLIQPVRVLIIDAENTERQWRRAARFIVRKATEAGVVDPTKEIHMSAGSRIDITKGADLAEIHRLVDIHQPDMLVIGPIYKITHGAITTDDDAAPVLEALDSLRERGLALVIEAHAAKGVGAGNRDWRPIGSGAQTRWPELGYGVDREPGASEASLVSWRGERETRKWPTRMRFGEDWPWEAD